jgi:hypothetical protein
MILGTFLTLYVVPALYTYLTARTAEVATAPEGEELEEAA